MKSDSGSARIAARAIELPPGRARRARISTKPVWNANVANGVDSSTSRSLGPVVQRHGHVVRDDHAGFEMFERRLFDVLQNANVGALGDGRVRDARTPRDAPHPTRSGRDCRLRRSRTAAAATRPRRSSPPPARRGGGGAYGRNPPVRVRGPFFCWRPPPSTPQRASRDDQTRRHIPPRGREPTPSGRRSRLSSRRSRRASRTRPSPPPATARTVVARRWPARFRPSATTRVKSPRFGRRRQVREPAANGGSRGRRHEAAVDSRIPAVVRILVAPQSPGDPPRRRRAHRVERVRGELVLAGVAQVARG